MNLDSSPLDIEVILVCDPVEDEDDETMFLEPYGDRPTIESFNLICDGLKRATRKVTHYYSLKSLIDNLHKHKEAVVFPYWFGELSRNRHSLVPSLCEAYGIPYVGADAYTKIVCNDKHLSKQICKEAGFSTPNGVFITRVDDLALLVNCKYPLVVKPNAQGSSLGIDDGSLAKNISEACQAVKRVSQHFGWPVLCEEFISGREISICMVGNHKAKPDIRVVSWEMNGDCGFLDNRLFTYSLKYIQNIHYSLRIMTDILHPKLQSSCEKLFDMLDKVEIMRVDCRLTAYGVTVIELSPDLDMRPDGEVAIAFSDNFTSYYLFLKHILCNTLESVGRQTPRYDKCKTITMSNP